MSDNSLYKQVLMDHYRHPRNKGDLHESEIVTRGRNPRCGDDIEIGVTLQGETLEQVKFRGRGCSVCMASASMMTEAVTGKSVIEISKLYKSIRALLGEKEDELTVGGVGDLAALESVRDYPARRSCVLLSWGALSDALSIA